MKLFAFAVLLVVAGAHATQDVEVGYGNRIADLKVKDFIERFVDYVINKKWDPYHRPSYDFNIIIVPRQAEATGRMEEIKAIGLSDIEIRTMKYNILWGILEYDVVFRSLKISLGSSNIKLRYGDARGEGEASGSVEVKGLGISGTAHLSHDISGNAHIKYLNPELKLGRINANVKIIGNGKDYSETCNNFLNVRVEELLKKFKYEINTILGTLIKEAYNRLKGWQ